MNNLKEILELLGLRGVPDDALLTGELTVVRKLGGYAFGSDLTLDFHVMRADLAPLIKAIVEAGYDVGSSSIDHSDMKIARFVYRLQLKPTKELENQLLKLMP
jgi:hypothetical protein